MVAGVLILVCPVALFGLQRLLVSIAALRPIRADQPLAYGLWMAPGLIAVGLVLAVPALRDSLSPGGVLDVNGPWALSAMEFLRQRLDPRLYLAAWVAPQEAMPDVVQVPLLAGLALMSAMALMILIRWGFQRGGLAVLLLIPVLVARLSVIVTTLMVGLYGVHLLNFWLLAIAIVVIQMARSADQFPGPFQRPTLTPSAPAQVPAAHHPETLSLAENVTKT